MTMPKPLIMHVVESFGGGTFESVRQLVHHTEPHVETLIVHGRRAETPKDFAKLFPRSTRFIELPMTRAINPGADLAAVRALRKLILEHNPKVVHGHSTKGGAFARLAALGTGRKVVYSPRGYAFLMNDAPLPKRLVYLLLEAILAKLPATTHACGHDEGRVARRLGNRVTVIPNAIDTDAIPATIRALKPGQKLQVVGGGRTSHQKGFDRFLATARLCMGLPIKFTWLGGGEGVPKSLPANLAVTGWLSQMDYLNQCAHAHLLLSLSRWEGLPRGVLEAMATGLPVLLTPIDGHLELVPKTRPTGLLAATPELARDALATLIETPARLSTLSQNARAHIEATYNIKHTLPHLLALYGVK